ncbi:MAG: hypothetical protein ACKVOU_13900 [Cytophagales bacterium]
MVLIVEVKFETEKVFEKLILQIRNNNFDNDLEGDFEFIIPSLEKTQRLEAIQSEKEWLVKAQKHEQAAEIVAREGILLSEILGVENHKDYLIYEGWINEIKVFIFRQI